MQPQSDSSRTQSAHSDPQITPAYDVMTRVRRAVCAVALCAASLAATPEAAAHHALPSLDVRGEGAVSPILRAHLSAKESTRLVVEIAANARCDRAFQVVFFELRSPQAERLPRGAEAPLDWRRRLAGSRFITKSVAVPGETVSLPLPGQIFGSVYALGALVISDSAASGPAGSLTFTSVRLPAQDPALPSLVLPTQGSIVVTEFMKDPMVVSDVRGEWLELQNRSSVAVDLTGWTLRDDGSNRTVIVPQVAGRGVVVPPGGFVVLAAR